METKEAPCIISAKELHAMDSKRVFEDRGEWIAFHYQLIIEQVIWRARRGLNSMIFPTNLLKDRNAVYKKKGDFKEGDHELLMGALVKKFPDCEVKFERYDDPEAEASTIDIEIRW